jgi:hypothetical protein
MLEYLKTTTHIVINEKGEQSETSDRKEIKIKIHFFLKSMKI